MTDKPLTERELFAAHGLDPDGLPDIAKPEGLRTWLASIAAELVTIRELLELVVVELEVELPERMGPPVTNVGPDQQGQARELAQEHARKVARSGVDVQ